MSGIKFSKRDFQRFGIDILKKNGFDVEVWDISRVVYPESIDQVALPDEIIDFEIHRIPTMNEVQKALSICSPACLFVCLFHFHIRTLAIYRMFSRYGLTYAALYINPFPIPAQYYSAKEKYPYYLKKIMTMDVKQFIIAVINKILLRYYPLFGVKAATICLLGGTRSLDFLNTPVDGKTERVWLQSLDYDIYLEEMKNTTPADDNLCVFIDAYFPTDPDRYYHQDVTVYNPTEAYYCQMKDLFNYLEMTYGIRIVIAEHPKKHKGHRENIITDFGKREGICGKTANMVKRAKFVLSHDSNAVNYAILFKKPIIFLTTKDIALTSNGQNIQAIAELLGKKPVYIDEPLQLDIKQEMEFDPDLYSGYIRAYIKKSEEQLPCWQIFADYLKKRNQAK
jgi:hypothetical protein